MRLDTLLLVISTWPELKTFFFLCVRNRNKTIVFNAARDLNLFLIKEIFLMVLFKIYIFFFCVRNTNKEISPPGPELKKF